MSTAHDLPVPGSLLLLEGTHNFADGSTQLTDIVLSPKPSNDINDPLNWSWKRKQIAHFMLVIYTLTSGIACCSLNSVLVPISVETGISIDTLVAGTGYMFLLLGWGGLITQPLALTFGKRPVYLFSQIGLLGTVIWMIYIKHPGEWLANKVVQGFFASPIESLIEVSIADVFFAHERGYYIGIYGMVLFGGNFLAPVWAGFVNDAIGKNWVFWVTAIQLIIGTLIMFFFMEETNYNRGTTEMVEKHDGDLAGAASHLETPEKETARDITQHTVVPVELDGVEKSFGQKLRMFEQRYTPSRIFFQMMYRPFFHLRFPAVVWSGVLYGTALIWYNVLNGTASVIFSGAPFHFSASMVGLTYLGPMIGAMVAFLWSGYAADKWLMYYTKKKQGVREPEYRLWLLGFNAIICPVGLILWGVGAGRGINWFGLVFGGGMVAFTSATGGAFAINYALDSYKDLSGEVMITVILIRNTMSFAVSYGITPWTKMGYQNAFIVAALVSLLFYSSFLVVIKYGKQWRAASKETYWRYVETSLMSHI